MLLIKNNHKSKKDNKNVYVLDARPKNKHPPTLARKGTGRVRLQFETLNPKIRHLHFDPLNRNNKVIYYDPKDRAGEGEVSWSYSCLPPYRFLDPGPPKPPPPPPPPPL